MPTTQRRSTHSPSFTSVNRRISSFAFLAVSAAVVTACTLGTPANPIGADVEALPAQPGSVSPTGPESATLPNTTPPIRPSTLGDSLLRAGVTLDALPNEIDDLEKEQLLGMMSSFRASLGVECKGCHLTKVESDGAERLEPKKSTPRKRVAERMYTEFVQKLRFKDGAPLYCDSCHQGKAKFLDRSNESGLRDWMHDNFATKLVKKDGSELVCATCHGTPMNKHFLEGWAAAATE